MKTSLGEVAEQLIQGIEDNFDIDIFKPKDLSNVYESQVQPASNIQRIKFYAKKVIDGANLNSFDKKKLQDVVDNTNNVYILLTKLNLLCT